MIKIVKIIHTLIWGIMTSAVACIVYSVYRMEFSLLFYISLVLIAGESLVIILNSWKCPLTGIARRYTDEDSPNFDIYLPLIVAKYNKEFFSVVLFIILCLYLFNLMLRN
jgi:hypothetical protein